MTWFFGVVVVVVMGAIALVAAGRGAPMVEEYDDRPDALVPATGDLAGRDLRRVRFSLTFRGYRMSEVDALLGRLATQLEAHEAWRPEQDAQPADQPAPPVDLGKPAGPTPDAATATSAERPRDDVPPG
ncbi:DivIVA domain-containing protein [Nocardioides sp. C4-1]|uniref:DivIVA domain-containing protein n=1 Tax=Nocardioides sp. C4-1 TaxID=3151851 RepID=UPI0032648921